MKNVILMAAALCARYCHGQVLSPTLSGYTAINAYSLKFADAFSITANQALLASLDTPAAGVYAEQRFMLKELKSCDAVVTWPLPHAGAGIALHYFGGPAFGISSAGVCYGKQLSQQLSAGIQFNYVTLQVAGYGSSSIINVEAGVFCRITDRLFAGMHIYNPAGGKFGKTDPEKLATVIKTGLGYEANDNVFICFEIEKQEDSPAGVNAGIQYIFAGRFIGRVAVETATAKYYAGLGLQCKTFRADIVSSYHPQLGFTPGLMLLFRFEKQKQQQP